MNIRVGRIGWLLAPGYSHCGKCETPWKFVRRHTTEIDNSRGCFPLCERCWQELETPEARLPFYAELWRSWVTQPMSLRSPVDEADEMAADWPRIKAAVLAEQ